MIVDEKNPFAFVSVVLLKLAYPLNEVQGFALALFLSRHAFNYELDKS